MKSTPEIEIIKPIIKYEISVDWHLKRLKKCIMTHYKDVQLKQRNFEIMDNVEIKQILENLMLLIRQCEEI